MAKIGSDAPATRQQQPEANGPLPDNGQGIAGEQEELWALLARQAVLYTGGESTSLPAETAGELLCSLAFCLGYANKETKGTLSSEATTKEERQACTPSPAFPPASNAAAALRAGQLALARQTRQAQQQFEVLKHTPPPCPSGPYQDTVEALAAFFTWYDIRFFAHQVPALICYPLAVPVADSLLGIEYVQAYIQRALWENTFCRRVARPAVRQLLDQTRPGWPELNYNLFEPVFAHALACQLLGKQPRTLALGQADIRQLAAQLLPLGQNHAALAARLHKAAQGLCNRLQIWQQGPRSYVLQCAQGLAVQATHTNAAGLCGLFAVAGP